LPEGARILRRYHEATLSFGDRRAAVRLVFDTRGRMVMPVEPAAASFRDLVLHMPDEVVGSVQVMASQRPIPRPEASEACDRWTAYHLNKPASAAWIEAAPEGAKTDAAVYEAEELLAENMLARDEGGLLRSINAHRVALGAACRRVAGLDVAEPLAVGVDPAGMDVRARFGIIRVEFPEAALSAEDARRMAAGLLGIPCP
jgi:hypothetical protein